MVALLVAISAPVADAAQYLPNVTKRTFAHTNANIDIDGVDDHRVDVDVAIFDNGVDLSHPDLNVVRGIDCVKPPAYVCESNSPDDGDAASDAHGTWAALDLGAIDNGIGSVGVAPGARIWAVKTVPDEAMEAYGAGETATLDMQAFLAAINLVVAARQDSNPANDMEVVLAGGWPGCPSTERPRLICPGGPTGAVSLAIREAITDAVDAGVTVIAGAGNWNEQLDQYGAGYDDVFAVSAMADTDGLPGSLGAPGKICRAGDIRPEGTATVTDDTRNPFSGWGVRADLAAPGGCTSTSLALAGGGAALLASMVQPDSRADVEDIRGTLRAAGNYDWTDTLSDGEPLPEPDPGEEEDVQEPLLDVGDEGVFDPAMLPGNGSKDTVGMFRPGDGAWNLRTANSAGLTNFAFAFSWGAPADVPLSGDWDGDGSDTIGMFRPGSGTWNLRNTNSGGAVDIEFAYYWGASWDVPVVGDWDGDGDDTIGMYRPGDGTWNLRNTNSSGATDVAFYFSNMTLSDIPVVGDWDGDGDDTIGLFSPSTGMWNLRNTNSAGAPDTSFAFNWGAAWDVPLAGDWDGDGDDTIGMYRPGDGTWNLRNTNSSGAVDIAFPYYWGATWDVPVTGNWDG